MKAVLCAFALLALSAAAQAAPLTVTNTNNSGAGSLRAAVAASASGDTITFDPAVTGTILLTSGQIQIPHALTITGPGWLKLAIDGNYNDRIFQIIEPGGGTCPVSGTDYLVSISGLELRGGRRSSDNSGGAIQTFHSLQLDSVVLDDNTAKAGGAVSFLTQYSGQSLTIANSYLVFNFARPLTPITSNNQGGAVQISENCFDNATRNVNKAIPVTVTISNSLFSANRVQPVSLTGWAGRGGAIFSYAYADITITDSRIVDNHVDVPNPPDPNVAYQGGALRVYAKSLTIQRTEVSDNSVFDATATDQTRGGGLHLLTVGPNLQTPADAMAVKIVDSTISGNSVSATAGAMLINGNTAVELDNTTISNNAAANTRTGGVIVTTGGTDCPSPPCPNASPPTLTMASSILANSVTGILDLAVNAATIPTFTVNADHSLIETICAPSASCGVVTVSGSGNFTATDPMLGSLGFNGGRTRTHPPLPGSPVIDAGANPLSLSGDQRNAPRVVGVAADMGAFESVVIPTRLLVPDGTSLKQTFGAYPDTKWFALGVEPGKTYVIEAADTDGDLVANAIGAMNLYDVDGVSPPPEANVDCSSGPRPPAVDVNVDGIRCVLRTSPPQYVTYLNKRPVMVKVSRGNAGGGSQFKIRAREATIYGRWLINNFDYHLEVENSTGDAMCVEVTQYPASGLTYDPYIGWQGGVGQFTMNVPAFGAVKNVSMAGASVGDNNETEGTFRIGACPSPANLIAGALHVSSYAFNSLANKYIYFFTTTANEGKTRSSW